MKSGQEKKEGESSSKIPVHICHQHHVVSRFRLCFPSLCNVKYGKIDRKERKENENLPIYTKFSLRPELTRRSKLAW